MLFFTISSAMAVNSTVFSDESQKFLDSADSKDRVTECVEGSELCEQENTSQNKALHKRCEEDPEWCEKNLDAEKSQCVENPESCEKKQDIPTDEKIASVSQEQHQELWCRDHTEICRQLQANTEKLADLEKQLDELRRELKQQNNRQKSDIPLEKTPKIETHSTDQ